MRFLILVVALLGGGRMAAEGAGEYVLILDGITNRVALGESRTLDLDGKTVEARLEKAAGTRFSRPMFSLSLKDSVAVNSSEIGEGVHQTLLATPRGALILVQEYESTNPESMVDIMLEEITKGDRDADFDVKTSDAEKSVGGLVMKGRSATSTQTHEEWVREVYGLASGERGVLIVTAIEMKNNAKEAELLADFWANLSLTLAPAEGAEQ